MKQVQFSAFGEPSKVVRLVDVPDPEPPLAWELIVAIDAFPINVADIAMLSGNYGTLPKLPSTVGMEAIGHVIQCGSSVTELQPGDRVVLLANNNWCERRKVPLAAVHKVSRQADLLQQSMLKVNPTTALLLLRNYCQLIEGDWIIQTAPLSSVGQCVLQLAKASGYRTINVVRRPATAARILELGGSIVLEQGPDLAERVKAAIGHEPVSLALDAVAGPGVDQLADCLADGAPIVSYGMLSNEACVLHPNKIIFRGMHLQGFWLSKILARITRAERAALMDQLGELIEQERLRIDIDQVFPLANVAQAIDRSLQSGRMGKVLVTTDTYYQ